MAVVSYSSKKLIPAPTVRIQKHFNKSPGGTPLSTTFGITVGGLILPFKGSPSSSGTFWDISGYPTDEVISSDNWFKSIIRKQVAIRELFSTDGLPFEIFPDDGSTGLTCYPIIDDINFPEGNWTAEAPYEISMTAPILLGFVGPSGEDNLPTFIQSAQESWTVELNEGQYENADRPQSFRVSHTVGAVGRRTYDAAGVETPAFVNAQNFVLPKLGYDPIFALGSGTINIPNSYTGRNQVRQNNLDEQEGSYSVTETWILTSGNYLEDFTVNSSVSADTGLTNVTIDGTITGLETRGSGYQLVETKFTAASGAWVAVSGQLFGRAQMYTGIDLNIQPLTLTVGKNPLNGVINYSCGFDNRASNIFADSISESITLNETFPSDVFATIPIPFREEGPILQPIYTVTESRRLLNIEVAFKQGTRETNTGGNLVNFINSSPSLDVNKKATILAIINAANPSNLAGVTQVFTSQNTENWDPTHKRYLRTIEWVYQ